MGFLQNWHSFGCRRCTPNLTKLKILIINENQRLLNLLSSCLLEGGHQVYLTNNPLDTSQLIKEEDPDLILMDLAVSYLTCFELISHCLLYTSPSPRDATLSRMPSSA